jgi:hypothetical protein
MDSLAGRADSAHYERRLGDRHPITVAIAWQPARGGGRRGRAKPLTAMTENLSINGAGFVSDHLPDLRATSMITVTISDATGPAQIRTIRPTEASKRSYYAVEFHDDQLFAVAGALITEHLKQVADNRPPPQTTQATAVPPRPDYRAWP